MNPKHTPQFDRFVRTIRLDELCSAAATHRGGVECRLGAHIIGGFNVIYELVFKDGVSWVARLPLPYNCFQSEEISASYAATLRYLKKHSKIPVPEVFGYSLKSDASNKVNATYILMERAKGRPLPFFEYKDIAPNSKVSDMVKKVQEQLTDIIFELSSLTFDKIGSLKEDPDGEFYVGTYAESMGTAYPKHKAIVYGGLDTELRGPFPTTCNWYKAMAMLNRKFALEDPDEDPEDRVETLAEYDLLAEMADKVVVEDVATGPFVICYKNLTVRNILVDENFNITGILDFPGTIVPLSSLCVFPYMFSDILEGADGERDAYLDVFLDRECRFKSPLQSRELRRKLMESALWRQRFELGFMGPYTSLVLPMLFEKFYGKPFERSVEHKRLASMYPWFNELIERTYGEE